MAYDNTNRWTLNKNDRKEKDSHPDYKGKINVDGVDYWLDGWIKQGSNGPFISGSIKPIEQRAAHKQNSGFPATDAFPVSDCGALDDDVPF